MLNKQSPIPLYYQLAEAIKAQVQAGELRPGMQLAGERELSEQYGISRMTVRQALQHLIREDVLMAKHGLGTFVAEPKLAADPLHLLSFTEEMLRRGTAASSQVIEQTVLAPPPGIAAQLQLLSGELATKIVRLRLSNQLPLALETVYVPERVFPDLVAEELAQQSLYRLLAERRAVRLHSAQQTLEAVPATQYECTLFEVPSGVPMLLLEGVAYDEHEQPIEYFKAVYRGDRFKIQLDSRSSPAVLEVGRVPALNVVMRSE